VTLKSLLDGLEGVQVHGPDDLAVEGLAYDSRRLKPGDLFFALPGLRHDGTAFVEDAWAKGAIAVVTAAPIEASGRTVVVAEDPRRTMAEVAVRFYDDPSATLELVGVTGTNGKTTTTWMLESIFRAARRNPGLIGTTGVRMAGMLRASDFTTPEAPELQALLAEMRAQGVRAVAMEVSSHALAQRRSYGLALDVAVFTNLTQDHLDYHGSMDAYRDAKLMMFDGRNGGRSVGSVAVINVDDGSAGDVIAAARTGGMGVLGVGIDPAGTAAPRDVNVAAVEPLPDGLRLRLEIQPPPGLRNRFPSRAGGEVAIQLPLLGRYNAGNAALAFGAALSLGIEQDTVVRGLENMPGVPGRLERVASRQPFTVLVDYAHTPDALARSLEAVRDHIQGRVLLVFGCGGDRDRAKRPLMGEIAERGADQSWITNDNPRSEDPAAIAHEIARGMGGSTYRIVLDRRAAIGEAIAAANPGDAVLVAGKGHETTQTIGDRVLPFDDREVARELLDASSGAGT
jgi:UDP-N-acetylmuramoyl-L-alanyl-D-glutamate--2,6-diaminopimelate ligase